MVHSSRVGVQVDPHAGLHHGRCCRAHLRLCLAMFWAMARRNIIRCVFQRVSVGLSQLGKARVIWNKLAAGVAVKGPKGPLTRLCVLTGKFSRWKATMGSAATSYARMRCQGILGFMSLTLAFWSQSWWGGVSARPQRKPRLVGHTQLKALQRCINIVTTLHYEDKIQYWEETSGVWIEFSTTWTPFCWGSLHSTVFKPTPQFVHVWMHMFCVGEIVQTTTSLYCQVWKQVALACAKCCLNTWNCGNCLSLCSCLRGRKQTRRPRPRLLSVRLLKAFACVTCMYVISNVV